MNKRELARIKEYPSLPQVLRDLDKLEREVLKVSSFKTLDDIADRAAGLQRRYKPVKAASDRAGEVWCTAEIRLGEELESVPKAKGASGPGRGKAGSKAGPAFTDAPTLAEMGVAKKRAARAHRLKAMPVEKRRQFIEELKEEGKAVTPDALLRKQREENKRVKKHRIATAAFSHDGPFDVVVIDPPWKVEKIDRDVRPNQDAFDYPTMTVEELAVFWTREMMSRLHVDCHLFMWTTHKYLPAALKLLDDIKFRYVLTMVWHKSGGFQPIGLPQYNCEFVVYARRGSPIFIDTTNFFCCFEGKRREHSRKPDVFYEIVRRVTGGSRIDVFSREPRDGFAQYGNQSDEFARAGDERAA